jgi:cytochrome P450
LPDYAQQRNLFNSVRGRWKRMRNIMNPTFSSAKLKELNPLMLKCSDRLVSKFDSLIDKEINVAELYKRFTMDAIWNCAFGVDINSQYDLDNPYFFKAEKVFRNSADFTWLMYLGGRHS